MSWSGTVEGYLLGAAALSGVVVAAGWFWGYSSGNSSSCRRMVVVAVLYSCGGRVELIILSDGKFRFCWDTYPYDTATYFIGCVKALTVIGGDVHFLSADTVC